MVILIMEMNGYSAFLIWQLAARSSKGDPDRPI